MAMVILLGKAQSRCGVQVRCSKGLGANAPQRSNSGARRNGVTAEVGASV